MKIFMYYQARDVMTPDPISVSPDDTLEHVEVIFEKHGFDAFPIVDEGNQILGMITKLDLLKAIHLSKTNWFPAIARKKISDVMTENLDEVYPEMPLYRILQMTVETGRKSFSVLEGERLVGIIAEEDILNALHKASLGVIPARMISPGQTGFIKPTNLEDKSYSH